MIKEGINRSAIESNHLWLDLFGELLVDLELRTPCDLHVAAFVTLDGDLSNDVPGGEWMRYDGLSQLTR